jgi:hypothetical protein
MRLEDILGDQDGENLIKDAGFTPWEQLPRSNREVRKIILYGLEQL